jgi:glycosyltransferase involved in cell wall biosynthesis
MNKQKIILFTPLAGRTGSEMMIWYILKHFDRSLFEITVVSFSDGELMKELPADVKGFVINKNFSLLDKLKFKLGHNPISKAIQQIQQEIQAAIWYVNTITLPEVYPLAKGFSVKVVTHFHELPLSFGILKQQDLEVIIENSDLNIGCAACVCDAIEQTGGKNVALLYSLVDTAGIQVDAKRIAILKEQLGIQENDTVWVMSGTTDQRKGFDFLPKIAAQLPESHHLIWVGGKQHTGFSYYVEQVCERLQRGAKIHILGSQKADYYNYLALADAFLLLSREDPYPLVMIEAAFLGKPIFAFQSGGVREFVQQGMGGIVQNFDITALVDVMTQWKQGLLPTDATISKARASQFDALVQLKNWEKIMTTNFLNG